MKNSVFISHVFMLHDFMSLFTDSKMIFLLYSFEYFNILWISLQNVRFYSKIPLLYFLNARHITWFVSVMLFSAFNVQGEKTRFSWDFRSCTKFLCLFLVFSTSPYVYQHLFTTTVELASMKYWNHHFQGSISCRSSEHFFSECATLT